MENELIQAATEIEKEVTQTGSPTEEEATQTGTDKEATSSFRAKRIKPTCSKLLIQSSEFEAPGSVSAYLALRERQKQGLPAPNEQDATEENIEENANIENEAGNNLYFSLFC